MYPIGTACSNLNGAVYKTGYDAWGNTTSRTYSSNSSTQAFDILNRLTRWNIGSTSKEWYAYDAAGDRVLRRSTSGSATTMTVYAFGSEEYTYDGTGNLQSSTHYYSLGGQLIGALNGSSTNLFLTDTLGSVLEAFSNTAGSAAVLGSQVFSPYGAPLYNHGSMGTNLGYTGQYHDSLSGFDYYGARYYDPVAGVFLSADILQGNFAGMNPYSYVGGNPETFTDPTGEMYTTSGRGGGGGTPTPPPPTHNNSGGGGIFASVSSIFWGGVSSVVRDTEQLAKVVADPETDPILPVVQKVETTVQAAAPEIEVFTGDAVDWAETAICPLCQVVLDIATVLANPIPLANSDLSTPITAPTMGNSPSTNNQPINIAPQGSGGGSQPQAGSGGSGQGNKPPRGGKPTAPPPDNPNGGRKSNPKNLYREGNASSPRIDNLRPGREISGDGQQVCPNEKGPSLFESIKKPGKWWKLPANTTLPDGLQFRNDIGDHWMIEPSGSMSVSEYKELLKSIQGWEPCF